MGVVTIYRLSEQISDLLEGDTLGAASSIDLNTLKIACGQVINSMLKTEYIGTAMNTGEIIPNGTIVGLYENIAVSTSNGKSEATLPIKPLRMPRNMGVYGVYPKYTTNGNYEYDKEFIPIQMGQAALIKSQPMINDIFGQVGYETWGGKLVFTKNIKSLYPDVVLAMRLVIMDISTYGDYDTLPVPPEMEWSIIQEVYKMYSTQPIPDKVVEGTVKEQKNAPLNQQKQTG